MKICGKIIFISFLTMNALLLLLIVMPLFGARYFTVASSSMGTAVKTRALVCVNTNNKQPRKRDIVAVATGGIPVLHRVQAFDGDFIITKGDANTGSERFHKSNVIGVMVFQIPYAGFLYENRYLLLIIATFAALYYVGVRLYRELGKKSGEL